MASFTSSSGTTFVFTEEQLATLTSILEPLFQSHPTPSDTASDGSLLPGNGSLTPFHSFTQSVPRKDLDRFFSFSFTELLSKPSTDPNYPNLSPFLQKFITVLVEGANPETLREVQGVFDTLNTRAGSWVLGMGYVGIGTVFQDLSVQDREKVIFGWGQSRFALFRKLNQLFTRLPLYILYSSNEIAANGTGYPFRGDPNLRDPSHASRLNPSIPYDFINISGSPGIQEQTTAEEELFETDVIIVGSGAGGGVVSKVLTEAGHRVLVLEKSSYIPTEILRSESTINKDDNEVDGESQHQRRAFREMYEGGAAVTSKDGSVTFLAGSTFGGGTSINWSASLRTPNHVREAWAKEHNLPHFLSSSFQDSVEAVCSRMGVSDEHFKDSVPNELIVKGAKKLGYPIQKIPQNTGGKPHHCGLCSNGCPFGEKQGTVQTFLLDAKNTGLAKFAIRVKVIRVLFSSKENPQKPTLKNLSEFSYHSTKRSRAVGVLAEIPSKQNQKKLIIVSARKGVVLSGGSLNSPAVLLRSGLGPSGSGHGTEKGSYWGNHNIGKNLHVHPVTVVTGTFDEVIKPWDGPIMTNAITVATNRDGSHFGALIEVFQSSIGLHAATIRTWEGSLPHKMAMATYNQTAHTISLVRDRDSGYISLDENGNSVVNYTISQYDADSVVDGMLACADIWLTMGAKSIITTQPQVPTFYPTFTSTTRPSVNDPDFLEWKALVRSIGVKDYRSPLGSAHQMGSCKMGDKQSNSVVDPKGRVWGTDGLYVADASVFPTASGVNPMITTMSTAHSIGQFIVADLK